MTQADTRAPRSAAADRRLPRLAADLVKYGFASAAALALDYAALLFFYKVVGVDYLIAAAIGFICGLALIYALSIRFVFSDRRSVRPPKEFSAFFAIGLAGLLLNELLMHVFVEDFRLAVALAKVPTAGLVFAFNFTVRRALLFSAPSTSAESDP